MTVGANDGVIAGGCRRRQVVRCAWWAWTERGARRLVGFAYPGAGATLYGRPCRWGCAPSGTVTFLFTDIEGSTGLWGAAPDAMQAALERHDAILRAVVDGLGGYIFSTGGME
jgi:hypothetical protein